MNQEIIKQLTVLSKYKFSPDGVCILMQEKLPDVAHIKHFKYHCRMYADGLFEHYSGCTTYPIAAEYDWLTETAKEGVPKYNEEAANLMYHQTYNMFEGEYGARRIAYIHHLINYFSKL